MVRSARRAFTLIELLVVIAIIAILAAILFPVFAQARASARSITCVSNVKQIATATLMYAQDYDETIPLLDNNGSSYYSCCPTGSAFNCYPDWGTPGTDPNEDNAMFTGVVQPYTKNRDVLFCPEAGKTPWQSAIGNPVVTSSPYVKALEDKGIYSSSFSQVAVNILLTEWGPSANWDACRTGGLWTATDNRMASWSRPAELMMFTGDSVWGMDSTSTGLAVGNTGVWPAYTSASQNCHDFGGYGLNGNPGWTWYIHRAKSRSGSFTDGTHYDLGISSGMANIAFCDGHVKPMKQPQLERCDYNTAGNVWTYTYWDPRY